MSGLKGVALQWLVKNRGISQQAGFSLMEVMLATFLFSATLLGLLQYQQVLQQQFIQQRDQQRAWRIAHRVLEGNHGESEITALNSELPSGWQVTLRHHRVNVDCLINDVEVMTSNQQQARLSQWHCD